MCHLTQCAYWWGLDPRITNTTQLTPIISPWFRLNKYINTAPTANTTTNYHYYHSFQNNRFFFWWHSRQIKTNKTVFRFYSFESSSSLQKYLCICSFSFEIPLDNILRKLTLQSIVSNHYFLWRSIILLFTVIDAPLMWGSPLYAVNIIG